jgi:hypothetical protein
VQFVGQRGTGVRATSCRNTGRHLSEWATSSESALLPVSKRPGRIDELKQEIEELQHLEEALVLAVNAERSPNAAPAAVLGCRNQAARHGKAA